MLKHIAREFGILWMTTAVVVVLGTIVRAFGMSSLFDIFDMALTLSIVSGISFAILLAIVWKWQKFENPGLAVPTGIAVLSVMIAIWLVGRVVPGTVNFSSFWLGLPFAALEIGFLWAFQLRVMKRDATWPMWPVLK